MDAARDKDIEKLKKLKSEGYDFNVVNRRVSTVGVKKKFT